MILQNGQVVEIKRVKSIALSRPPKTRGKKMKVSPTMLLKTHVEKMSVYGLATMFKKTK
jgi:hypothetical protein